MGAARILCRGGKNRGAEWRAPKARGRGAAGAEGVGCEERVSPSPLGVWGGGCSPSPENFSIFELKRASFGAF